MNTTILKPSNQAKDIFQQIVKGKNFMTPYLLGFYLIKDGAVELTEGDFMGDEIFGVTVVRNNEHDYDAGKCCHSKQEALDYITSLQ